MELTVEKAKIINGLQTAASILPAKAGAAYFRSIWLKAENEQLSLMATDASLEFTANYPVDIKSPGLTGVQGRLFVDLVRQLPNGPLHLRLEEKENVLHIRQGKSSYRLPVASQEWFQEFSPYPAGEGVIWTGSVFAEYLDRVAYSISDEEGSDALGCLYMRSGSLGKIDICGLNGHQFALATFINDALAEKLPEKGLLIERKYLLDLKKWLAPDEIELRITDKKLYLKKEDIAEILAIPRSHYEYPDYNVFMEKLDAPDVSRLILPRKEACDALGRLQVFNTEQDRGVGIELYPAEVKMSVQGGDLGSARETLEVEYSGNLERIALPTKNLLEIFSHFSSDAVHMVFTGSEGPCGITAPEDKDYIVIIMPMKVASGSYYNNEE